MRTFSKFGLILGIAVGYVGYYAHPGEAKKHSDDGGDDEGDEDQSDDNSKDDSGAGEEDGDNAEDDKDQPAITAGGLFTISSYPVRELARPLTMTKQITQLRLGIGTDISAKGAFASVGADLDAIYGLSDNFEIIGGLNSAYNFNQFSFYGGFEGALVYDVVDIRIAANIHRNAVPAHYVDGNGNATTLMETPSATLAPGYGLFCNPPTIPNEEITVGHTSCGNGSNATQDLLPSGDYLPGGTQFSVDIGFPFRYSFTKEIAIVALQTLMSIDFNSVGTAQSCSHFPFDCKYDHIEISSQQCDPTMDPMCDPMTMTKPVATPRGNGAKPDLKPSVGIATNPIAALSLVIFAQLRVPDFDTAAGAFQIPVSLRAEFSPSQKFDIGLMFTLLNVKPPDPQSPLDNRFISTFMQARF